MNVTCKVCAGAGSVEGERCIFCAGRGSYQAKKDTYEDPPCGEVVEIDI